MRPCGRVSRGLWVLMTIAGALAGCAGTSQSVSDGMKSIEGQVIYRERMLLPPNAEIQVTLEDVAGADVPATIVASKRFPAEGAPPYPFTLDYDPAEIDSKGRYALRARIEADSRLMFTNDTYIPAFGAEAKRPAEIQVVRATTDPDTPAMSETSLTDTYWKLIELDHAPAGLGAGDREPFMVLGSVDSRVHGFGGCNRFMGGYAQYQSELIFSQLASTMMACIDGMDLERRFLEALGQVKRYAISGKSLMLYGEGEQPILRFESGRME